MPDAHISDPRFRKVPIREVVSWLVGAFVGVYLGIHIGLLVGKNLAPIVGAVIGWGLFGYSFWHVSRLLWRSEPKLIILAGSVQDGFLGLIICSLAGGFISEVTEISRLVGIVVGAIVGMSIGIAIGERFNRRELKKDAEVSSLGNGV